MNANTHPAHDSIGTRLARMAQAHGDKPAIVEQGRDLGYGALDGAADAIARRIVRASGGIPGGVSLLFASKLATVEAIAGTCRSGRAFVPLDADDPDDRLRAIVADCSAVVLLTQGSLVDRARAIAGAGCTVIDVDDARADAGDAPLPHVAPQAPALICYTSGSTGRPKGVVQTHANLLHFADVYATSLHLDARDRFSLLYTLSFAAGINAVVRSLALGATLCAYDMRRDGVPRLAEWLDRERVSLLQTVPTVFRALCNGLPPERVLPYLRAIHLAGEPLFAQDVERFRRHTPAHCVLMNQLGSTETCFVAQHFIAHADAPVASGMVGVGRAVDGVEVEIRDDAGGLVAAGEVGEIVVCSPHLSPGYWRRPDLDAAAFADDARRPGWRTYRSGDIGRIDDNGDLHFIGRKGSRVKVRGHSIDLAEVEAALAACPGVAEAAVASIGDETRMEPVRLVAHVAMRDGAAGDPRSMRRALAQSLPAYMLPSAIAMHERLPTASGGKVDRAALARLRIAPDAVCAPVAPRDEVERTVAGVFARLLNVADVGRDDDFFLLGGDSLLGTQLQLALLESLGVRVGFHDDATVAGIAGGVRDARARPPSHAPIPVLVPLWRHGERPPLFLVHGRHGQAHVSPHFMKLLGDDQPVWSFQARGLDGVAAPHASIVEMAADYVSEVRRVRAHGPYFLGALCVGAYVVAEMARLLRTAGEEVLPLLLLDPPNRVLARTTAHADAARVAGKMKARRAQGRIAGPLEDPRYLEAAIRTAAAFNDAVARHRPQPYDGAVYVLSSRARMQGVADPLDLRRIFTGRFKRYEVGTTHGDALDPRNPMFASTLRRCVDLIRESAIDPAPDAGRRQARWIDA
ncbi:MAG TPA: AMP-binding protein [Casimicrobiaceae bacterium]|nr:AMP-binding protein [Casimicrobiaceae bacterium]